MNHTPNSRRLRYEINVRPQTNSNTESTPSPLWGEGWGEGKEAQPSSSATTYHRLRTDSTKATPDHLTASNTGSTPSPLGGEGRGEGKKPNQMPRHDTHQRLRTNSTKATPDHKDRQQHRINPLAPLGERAGVRERNPTRCLATTHTTGAGLTAPKQRQTAKTASNTGSTPSPLWGEGWGEGKRPPA